MLSCTHHASELAVYRCGPCDAVLCEACARELPGGERAVAVQCRACDAVLEPLAGGSPVTRAAALGVHTPLWHRIDDIVSYGTRSTVLLSMLALALAVAFLETLAALFGIAGFLIALFAFGLEAALFFRVLETSANGDDDLDPPDISTPLEVIFGPALWYAAAVAPALAPLAIAGVGSFEPALTGELPWASVDGSVLLLALWLAGLALLPLLFSIAAIARSVRTMYNPVHWIRTLRLLGWDYAAGAAMFYALYAVEILVAVALTAVVRSGPAPLVGAVAVTVPVFAVRALRFRALGVMCEPYMQRTSAPPEVEPTGRAPARDDGWRATGSGTVAPAGLAPRVAAPAAVEPPATRLALAIAAADRRAAEDCASDALASPAGPHDAIGLYRGVRDRFPDLPLSDRALATVAAAADQVGDARLVVHATSELLDTAPTSPLLPRALWLTAQAHDGAGRRDASRRALEKLIEVAPFDPFADRARRKLDEAS